MTRLGQNVCCLAADMTYVLYCTKVLYLYSTYLRYLPTYGGSIWVVTVDLNVD